MDKILRWIAFGLSAFLIGFFAWYSQHYPSLKLNSSLNSLNREKAASAKNETLEAPELKAQAALVGEIATGKILYEKNPRLHIFPASLVKLMSAMIVLDNLDIDKTEVYVSEKAVATEGNSGYLVPGEIFKASDLLKMALIMSSNDAIMALAEKIGLNKFVGLMNQKALEIGLSETGFFDPVGFDHTGNFSTASDLFKMSQYLYLHYPILSELTRADNFNVYSLNYYKPHLIVTTNKLKDKIDGLWLAKTGYTPDGQECLLMIYPLKGKMIASIVVASSDRFGDSWKLYQWLKNNIK
jgi:D-alanyl-D-alanine carboxypeptidase